MPCNSDHCEQNRREAYNQRTAKLLLYCYEKHPIKGGTDKEIINVAANTYYCDTDFTMELCSYLKMVCNKPAIKKDLFNINDKTSRDLMDWWQEHQEADKERERQEVEAAKNKELRRKAILNLVNSLARQFRN